MESLSLFILLLYAFFQGIIWVRIFGALGDWLVFRRLEYLYQAGYLFSLNVFILANGYYVIQLFLQRGIADYTIINDYGGNYFKCFLYASAYLYSKFYRTILNIDLKHPRLVPLFEKMLPLFLIPLGLLDILWSYLHWYNVSMVFCSVTMLLYFLMGLYVLGNTIKRCNTLSMLIGAGSYAFLFGAALSAICAVPEFLWGYRIFKYPALPIQIGSLLEIIIFNFALNYKNQIQHEEKLNIERELREDKDFNTEVVHSFIKSQVRHIIGKVQDGSNVMPQYLYEKISVMLTELQLSCDFSQYFSDAETDRMGDLVRQICSNLQIRWEKKDAENDPFHYEIAQAAYSINLTASQKFALIFFIYEAVQNISRHAQATEIELRLNIEAGKTGRHVRLEINDNGCGMPAALKLHVNTLIIHHFEEISRYVIVDKHIFGLRKLFQKAQMLNGNLSIHSSEEGTRLLLYFTMNI
jgi:hypothetical protein